MAMVALHSDRGSDAKLSELRDRAATATTAADSDVEQEEEELLQPVVKNTFVDLLEPSARDRNRQLRPLRSCSDAWEDPNLAALSRAALAAPSPSPAASAPPTSAATPPAAPAAAEAPTAQAPTATAPTATAAAKPERSLAATLPPCPEQEACYVVVKNSFLEFREADASTSSSSRSLARSVSLPADPPCSPCLGTTAKPLSPLLQTPQSPAPAAATAPAPVPLLPAATAAPAPAPGPTPAQAGYPEPTKKVVSIAAAPAATPAANGGAGGKVAVTYPPPRLSQRSIQIPGTYTTTATKAGIQSRYHNWVIDAAKLRGNHKLVVSPPLEVTVGSEVVVFRMIITAKPPSGGITTANFQRSKAWGAVQVKCEAVLPDAIANVTYRLWVGTGQKRQKPRGPVHHNFAQNAISELPKEAELWNFGAAVDPKTSTVVVCLEEIAPQGDATSSTPTTNLSVDPKTSAVIMCLDKMVAKDANSASESVGASKSALEGERGKNCDDDRTSACKLQADAGMKAALGMRLSGFDWQSTLANIIDNDESSDSSDDDDEGVSRNTQ